MKKFYILLLMVLFLSCDKKVLPDNILEVISASPKSGTSFEKWPIMCSIEIEYNISHDEEKMDEFTMAFFLSYDEKYSLTDWFEYEFTLDKRRDTRIFPLAIYPDPGYRIGDTVYIIPVIYNKANEISGVDVITGKPVYYTTPYN